jgi:hypothetical protein
MAAIDIHIDIPLPPPIVFPAPPEVIAMPETSGVCVAPDIDVDLYFWNGFWWRLWEGRWYRSAYYDRDWVYYNNVPSFYFNIDPHWGEDTTITIIGTGTSGTINGFFINDFSRTGRVGKRTDLGEGKKPGASRDIHLEHKGTRRY